METIVLSRPFVFEDKEYKEIVMDFEGLTGQDLISASNTAKTLGDASLVFAEASKAYLAAVAAQAAKVPVELIMALPAKDFTAVTLAVQNFLFG